MFFNSLVRLIIGVVVVGCLLRGYCIDIRDGKCFVRGGAVGFKVEGGMDRGEEGDNYEHNNHDCITTSSGPFYGKTTYDIRRGGGVVVSLALHSALYLSHKSISEVLQLHK